jgi:hypothetical protein
MGNFYANFSVKSSAQQQVVDILQQAQRIAVITPSEKGYIVVYDEEADTQAIQPILDVGSLLSEALKTPVLAVLNHDDSILCYWLFDQGSLVDSFNSRPDYFDDFQEETHNEQGGDPERLCSLLKPDADSEAVNTILREKYLFAIDQHRNLADFLGLPKWSVGVGFNSVDYLEAELEDEELIDLEGEEFIHLGESPIEFVR